MLSLHFLREKALQILVFFILRVNENIQGRSGYNFKPYSNVNADRKSVV